MKRIFFTFLTIAISTQCYSQTIRENFQHLSNDFMSLGSYSDNLKFRFYDLQQYSEWNAGEHGNMGQWNLANNWTQIRTTFEGISNLLNGLSGAFYSANNHIYQNSVLFEDFDGSYSSLSGLPSLFDGNFSSLSGTPTTLAGYGITDGFSGNYSDLSGKPTFRDLSSSSPVVFAALMLLVVLLATKLQLMLLQTLMEI